MYRDALSIIRDPEVTDREKEMLIMKNLIPLFYTSANNHSVNMKNVFNSSCFVDYISVFLPSLTPTAPTASTSFIIALLKLNTLLVKYCSTLIDASAKTTLFSFAWNLYRSADDGLISYSLLFLCQFVKEYKVVGLVSRLFLNIIHFYNNAHIDVIYKASGLLSDGRSVTRG